MSKKRTHHFRGLGDYNEKLLDFAEGRPTFTGRGQQPRNKEVLDEIAAIRRCQKESFFNKKKACTCGWHAKAAARKKRRLEKDLSGAPPAPSTSGPSVQPTPPGK